MLTKSELDLLHEIYNHNGNITLKKQSIFKNNVTFYKAIHNLKEQNFIIISNEKKEDKRIIIYEITLKGIQLYKLLWE